MRSRYDIVIIGAGLGGLECGHILSKKGYSVCVLEKEHIPGGALQSYMRRGEELDTGLHYVGGLDEGQPLHRLFSYLGLTSLPWRRLDPQGFDEVILPEGTFLLRNGYDAFRDSLTEAFPHQKEALRIYTSLLKQVGDSTFDGLRAKDTSELSGTSLFSRSAWEFLSSTVSDPLLRNVLSGTCLKMELSKQTLPLYIFAQINSSFIQSAWRLDGGGSLIAGTLTESIRKMGGTVLCGSQVTALKEQDGRLTCAVLSGGEEISAGIFISDIHPASAISLIGESACIRNIYRRRICALRNTGGTFTASLLLRPGSVPYLNRNRFIYECPDVWEPSPTGTVDRAMVSFRAPSDGDSARCIDLLTPVRWEEVSRWAGTRPGHRGEAYKTYKAAKAEELVDFACRHTDLRKSDIEHIFTSSPLTWTSYTGTPEGSSYGLVKDWRDPLRTVLTPRTPVPNLFLTGQSLNLHGVLGVSMTSLITCSAVTGETVEF